MRYIVKNFLGCERCPLHESRRKIVFGRGKVPADVLFVGDAPGKSEDLTGLPFIGPAGKILDEGIQLATKMAGVVSPSVFVTYAVSCCTPELNPPSPEQAWSCWPRLETTFSDINPKRVVLLGKVAESLLIKAWPEATCLPHPLFIYRLGGVESPAFRAFARDLSVVFKEVSG